MWGSSVLAPRRSCRRSAAGASMTASADMTSEDVGVKTATPEQIREMLDEAVAESGEIAIPRRALRGRHHPHSVRETRAVADSVVQPHPDHAGQLHGVAEVHCMGRLVHHRDGEVLRGELGNFEDAVG